MLTVQGLLVIPRNNKLKKMLLDNNRGAYLDFVAVSIDNKNDTYHQYSINLWVKNEELKDWEQKILPNKIFLLKSGNLYAPIKEGKEYSLTSIKTTSTNLIPLKVWYEKEEK
jgi:hypothetical protein